MFYHIAVRCSVPPLRYSRGLTSRSPVGAFFRGMFFLTWKFSADFLRFFPKSWVCDRCLANNQSRFYLHSVHPPPPPFSYTSVSYLIFTVKVIKLKLLKEFLERCRTKAPSTSLSPTCWLAFSTPARTSEQRVSRISGTNTHNDGCEEKRIQRNPKNKR